MSSMRMKVGWLTENRNHVDGSRSPKGNRKQVQIGWFGVLHPEVLGNFDIQYPVSCMELDLETLA
jgi:hypothetical protein